MCNSNHFTVLSQTGERLRNVLLLFITFYQSAFTQNFIALHHIKYISSHTAKPKKLQNIVLYVKYVCILIRKT